MSDPIQAAADEANACFDAGNEHKRAGRHAEAEACYRRAMQLQPAWENPPTNLGNMLQSIGRRSEAETLLRRALSLSPGSALSHNNLAVTLMAFDRLDEAVGHLRRAIALDPRYAEAYGNLGYALMRQGHFAEAERILREALVIKPQHHEARYNLGHLELVLGRFEEGWEDYEARRLQDAYPQPVYGSCAPWRGEPLGGKRLLLAIEQGLGDQLQFVRYAKALAAMGATVDAWVAAPLGALIATVPGLSRVFTQAPEAGHYDYWVPLPGLPRLMRTRLDNVPAEVPYVFAEAGAVKRWGDRLDAVAQGRLKVGLVWAGNPTHAKDNFRSMPLSTLAPLAGTHGCAFFSLQKGPSEVQLATPPEGLDLTPLGPELASMADTAALIANLDVVLTVDTAVGHLAGALGKPAWIMLDGFADWRWLRDRPDSPWYPSVRLFRQRRRGDWAPVLSAVVHALEVLGAERATQALGEALVHRQSGRLVEAEAAYKRAIALAPQHADVHGNLGVLYAQQQRYEEALACVKQAVEVAPADARLRANLALALMETGRAVEAEASARRALALDPRQAHGYNALSTILLEAGRMQEAEACLREGLDHEPDHPQSRFNLAHFQLRRGFFREGFANYAWRVPAGLLVPPTVGYPAWRGEDLQGKRLLLVGEQGLGDQLQFVRYAAVLAARGATVDLVTRPELTALMAGAQGVSRVLEAAPPAGYDTYCMILSAPQVVGTELNSIPASVPYLAPAPARREAWRARLDVESGGRRKVGLVWAGSNRFRASRARSLPAHHLATLSGVPGLALYSLQKGEPAADATGLALVELGPELTDFQETAAAILALDLVITVDTAVAHLAGALGKPVWVLLDANAEWRWLTGRDDSPWYPTMRLFRQGAPGDWAGVLAEVRDALSAGQETAASAFETANGLKRAGRHAAAEAAYRRALALDPGESGAWTNLGNMLADLGRLPEAEASLREALARLPEDAVARRNLALVLERAGRFGEAEVLLREAVAIAPTDATARFALAVGLANAGRSAEAEAAYQHVLAVDEGHLGALLNMSNLVRQDGRLADAEALLRRLTARHPAYADGHGSLGRLLKAMGRLDEAEASFREAARLAPEGLSAWTDLAVLLQERKRMPDALDAMRKVASLDPSNLSAHVQLANMLVTEGQPAEAEREALLAAQLAPDRLEVLHTLALVYKDSNRLALAETQLRRALDRAPDDAGTHNNLSLVLTDLDRLDEAETHARRAIELKPDAVGSHASLGWILKERGLVAEGEAELRHALALDPEFDTAHYNLGHLLLQQGRFAEGFAGYERRLALRHVVRKPQLPWPEWQGEDLTDKRILVVGEQGLGDQIQFSRYARLLKDRGAHVDMVVQPPLTGLLKRVDGVASLFTAAPVSRPYDCWVMLMSLPHRFGTDEAHIPAGGPYLTPDPARVAAWSKRLHAPGKLKVGLVWGGNPHHKTDHCRSMPLDALAPLGKLKHTKLYALQKGPPEAQLEHPPAGLAIEALGPELHDFEDTAGAIANLDLVLTVDTSVAHVAGAMGKEVWLMLSDRSDWRWLETRTDTPWYPTMRLFRQQTLGDWGPVVASVVKELKKRKA